MSDSDLEKPQSESSSSILIYFYLYSAFYNGHCHKADSQKYIDSSLTKKSRKQIQKYTKTLTVHDLGAWW